MLLRQGHTTLIQVSGATWQVASSLRTEFQVQPASGSIFQGNQIVLPCLREDFTRLARVVGEDGNIPTTYTHSGKTGD